MRRKSSTDRFESKPPRGHLRVCAPAVKDKKLSIEGVVLTLFADHPAVDAVSNLPNQRLNFAGPGSWIGSGNYDTPLHLLQRMAGP